MPAAQKLEVGRITAEDASWLQKKDDVAHFNVAELETVIKGINLALKWGLQEIKVKLNSVTGFLEQI